jgi:hypothetical protein
MSDRTFSFFVTIVDRDTETLLTEERVTFDPLDTDEHGNNETVIMAVEAWLKRAKYDAQQMDIEAEQRLPENVAANRADHFFKLCQDFAR